MRKMVRCILSLCLVASMIFALVACGSSDTSEKTDETVKEETSKEENKTSEKEEEPKKEETEDVKHDPLEPFEETVSVSIGKRVPESSNLPEGDTFTDNAYYDNVKEMLNIEIDHAFEATTGEDYDRQVSLAIASGELPDIMSVSDYRTLKELVDNDLIADLTDVFASYMSDEIIDDFNSFGDTVMGNISFDGKIMALPHVLGDCSNMIWIREDWLEKLDLTIDTDGNSLITREELEMVAQAFVEADPDNSGNPVGMAFAPGFKDIGSHGVYVIASSFGAHLDKWMQAEDGTVYNGNVTTEAKEALTYLSGLYEKGLIDIQYGTRTSEDIDSLIVNGQLGIYFGPWWYCGATSAMHELNPDADWIAYGLDNGEGKFSYAHSNPITSYTVVRKGYENPEVVAKLANHYKAVYANSAYNLEQMISEYPSIQGVLEYLDLGVNNAIRPLNGEIQPIDANVRNLYQPVVDCIDGKIEDYEMHEADNDVTLDAYYAFTEDQTTCTATQWTWYLTRFNGIGLQDRLEKAGLYDWVNPVYGASTDTLNERGSDLDKLVDETFVKFITGSLSMDEFDSFVEEWNAMGGATICEEMAAAKN